MSFTSSRSFKRVRQRVTVYNGGSSIDPDLECLSISFQHGQAANASFSYTKALWDSNFKQLSRALLYVEVDETGNNNYQLIFAGYMLADSGSIDPSTNKRTFSAGSPLTMLKDCYVGQKQLLSSVVYPAVDPITLQKTQWNSKSVLQDIFNNMPDFYADMFRLGNTTVLNSASAPVKEFAFNLTDYQSAINTCLAVFGDISFRERFSNVGGPVYLDFFRVNDPAGANSSLTIPVRNKSIYQTGANVQSMSASNESNGCKSRVIGYGANMNVILSAVAFVVNVDESQVSLDVDDKLIKGWDVKNVTISDLTLTNEEWVLLNPDRANKTNKEFFHPDCEFCFRLWYLPRSLWGFTKNKSCKLRKASTRSNPNELLFEDRKGVEMKPQIWKKNWVLTPTDNELSDYVAIHNPADFQNSYIIIDGAKFELDDNYFLLKNAEDGLDAISTTVDDKGEPEFIYAPAEVGCTFAIELGRKLTYDTGIVPASHDLSFAKIGTDGLTDSFELTDMEFTQINLLGFGPDSIPIVAYNELGQARYWTSCIFYDEELKIWNLWNGQTIMRNDSNKLRNVCESKLMETNRRRRTSEATIPYITTGFNVGGQVQVNNKDNHIYENLCVGSMSLDLVTGKTSVTFDNVKPAQTTKFII